MKVDKKKLLGFTLSLSRPIMPICGNERESREDMKKKVKSIGLNKILIPKTTVSSSLYSKESTD